MATIKYRENESCIRNYISSMIAAALIYKNKNILEYFEGKYKQLDWSYDVYYQVKNKSSFIQRYGDLLGVIERQENHCKLILSYERYSPLFVESNISECPDCGNVNNWHRRSCSIFKVIELI